MTEVQDPQHLASRPTGPWAALLLLPTVSLIIPSALVLAGPLQSNGWPPRLMVFWCALAIVLGWLVRPRSDTRTSPAEVGSWILLVGLIASVGAAGLRLVSEEEAAGVIRAALVMFPLVIVALGIAQSADRRLSDLLLVGIVIGASASAVVAALQFVSPFDFASTLRLPGMVAREIGGMGGRGDFTRVKGATSHPIEFGVISGAVVPIAIHYGRFAATHRRRVTFVAASVLLLVSLPMSVSRSGILTVTISMAIYSIVLTNRQRLNLLIIALAGIVLMRAAIPGLLGTIRSIFVNVGSDDSISGRTEDYAVVERFFAESPLVGRGLGTFRPEEYFFLDNQYLMALVEGGLVLLLATISIFVLAMASARGAVLRTGDRDETSKAQAVIAGIASVAVSGLFFDLFSFEQATVMTFVLIGVAGAIWHEAVKRGRTLPSPGERIRAVPAPSGARLRSTTGS